jgi:2-aminobenzoate-CoA ligase
MRCIRRRGCPHDRPRRHLCARPPAAAAQMPEFLFRPARTAVPAAPELRHRACSTAASRKGDGDRPCVQGTGVRWTYAELQAQVDRIARVLVEDLGLVPGNRVLLRGANTPMLAACWFAGVVKAGGIAVGSDAAAARARAEGHHRQGAGQPRAVRQPAGSTNSTRRRPTARPWCIVLDFNAGLAGSRDGGASRRVRGVDTAAEDICLIAFTSGTTGVPKGTMHFHRDLIAACACWPPHVLRARADDVFIGSPPLAFTFGLGGLLLFPLSIGASTVLLEKASPTRCPRRSPQWRHGLLHRAHVLPRDGAAGRGARPVVAAQVCLGRRGAAAATRALWKQATGIQIIDGIGSTEMLHIFISRRRGACPARRHRPAGARLPRRHARRRRPRTAARPGRPAGREGPHRLQVPGRRAPGDYVHQRLEPDRRRLPRRRPTASSSTRRAPTT